MTPVILKSNPNLIWITMDLNVKISFVDIKSIFVKLSNKTL